MQVKLNAPQGPGTWAPVRNFFELSLRPPTDSVFNVKFDPVLPKGDSMEMMITAAGRIKCRRCGATSKRSGLQCGAVAIRGKGQCRFHGGRSTGPKTIEGRARCAAAKTVHGRDTRQARKELSEGLARLAALEALGLSLGMFTGGRTRGPKPRG